MGSAPATSITLLKGLASGTDNARWLEFHRIYEQPMRSFLRAHYPSIDEDDALQETMIALTKRMPSYHYTPDTNGHFRCYLFGILKHKAEDALRRRARESDRLERLKQLAPEKPQEDDAEDWRIAAMNTALEQLLSDDTINARTREVFRHVAVMHEPPEAVASAFGITRNNVDQIKKRLIDHLSRLVASMTEE